MYRAKAYLYFDTCVTDCQFVDFAQMLSITFVFFISFPLIVTENLG